MDSYKEAELAMGRAVGKEKIQYKVKFQLNYMLISVYT